MIMFDEKKLKRCIQLIKLLHFRNRSICLLEGGDLVNTRKVLKHKKITLRSYNDPFIMFFPCIRPILSHIYEKYL